MKLLARPIARIAICAGLTFHLAAITVANLPASTALGSKLYAPFAWYLTPTGLWQTWDMFTTIPHFLELGGSLVAIDEQGQMTRYGPLLPGFTPFVDSTRIQGSFMRLAFSNNLYPSYSKRYRAAVCKALVWGHIFAPSLKETTDPKAVSLGATRDFQFYGVATKKTYFTLVMATLLSACGGGTYSVTATFDDVGDLQKAGAVQVADVRVGNISSISLTPDFRAKVSMALNRSVHIPKNSEALVRTTSLLGEKFIELHPLGDPTQAPYLSSGDTVTHTLTWERC